MQFFLLFVGLTTYTFAKGACPSGLIAFKKHVYPILKVKCASCHGDLGPAPVHSGSDPQKAYEVAKTSVNFSDVKSSYFVQMVDIKHWSRLAPNLEGITTQKAIDILTLWKNGGEDDCGENRYGHVSSSLSVDRKLVEQKKQNLRFDLSNLAPFLEDSFFEVELSKMSDGLEPGETNYLFTKPRLSTPINLYIKGLNIRIDKRYNPLENLFSNLETVIHGERFEKSDEILPGKILALGGQLIVDQAANAAQFNVSVAFEELKQVENKLCINPVGFEKFRDQLADNCISCHADPNNLASQRMNMAIDLCQQVSQRINRKHPWRSTFLGFPVNGFDEHEMMTKRERVDFLTEFKKWLGKLI